MRPEPAKIVARYVDGRVVKGYSYDFSADHPRFRLYPVEPASPEVAIDIPLKDLKAVFFVRDFAGNAGYREQKQFPEEEGPPGRRIAIEFVDGEILVGYTLGYDRQRPGFFLVPADPRSNNLRVFVVSSAVREVREGPGAPEGRAKEERSPEVVGAAASGVDATGRLVEDLRRENRELRARCERLEREPQAFRDAYEGLRREHDVQVRTLEGLRAAHERLRQEHETSLRTLRELGERHDALLREWQRAADELARLVTRMRGLG
jgi:hypothetical protein